MLLTVDAGFCRISEDSMSRKLALAAIALAAAVTTLPAHAGLWSNGWMNGVAFNGWQNGVAFNGWVNGWSSNGWSNGWTSNGWNNGAALNGAATVAGYCTGGMR